MTKNGQILSAMLLAGAATLWPASVAQAQPAASAAEAGELADTIVVTARKRDELITDVPVAVTAFGKAQLERFAINSVDELADFTPGLITSESAVSSGGSIFLRGIGTGSSNALSDQSVAINIDGMQVGTFNVRKSAQIDVAQIEVLRGPQALFFGKNSPGGVVSFKTADPGPEWETELSGSHEFVSDDDWLQLVVSGPLSDDVGLRLVGRYTDLGGYFNIRSVPANGDPLIVPSRWSKWPTGNEQFLRGTLVVDPVAGLRLRAKASYSRSLIHGGSATAYQRIACPYGTPQLQPDFPCRADRDIYLGSAPDWAFDIDPRTPVRDGLGQRKNQQFLGTFEADYDLTEHLQATAIAGYYWFDEVNDHNPSVGPRTLLITPYLPYNMKQFTQEVRLTSSWDSPINFAAGVFHENTRSSTEQNGIVLFLPPAPFALGAEFASQKQQAWSMFGQLIVKPVATVEISGGLRWSHEAKRIRMGRNGVDLTANLATDHIAFNNLSPEVTVSWHVDPDVMVFASYKRGFKSGGFDAGFTNGGIEHAPFDNNYAPEHVKGVEAGLKATPGNLFVDLTGYRYDYTDLQVSTYDPNTISFRVLNAASARIQGLELNANWRTPLRGLTLNGSLAYNDAKFRHFLAGCFVGQTPAMGCDVTFNPATGAYLQQDLSGRRINNAPAWSGTAGANYRLDLAGGQTLDLAADLVYSDSFTTSLLQGPYDRQGAFARLDASIKFTAANRLFDIMLIGRNLTNKYTVSTTSTITFTGAGSGTNDAILGDIMGVVSRGREVFLQATFRPKILN